MTGLDYFLRIFAATDRLQIVDAGAHIGDSVESFLDHFPRAEVYAFEPVPANFERLKTRFFKQVQVFPYEAAIGPVSGRSIMHLNNHDATHSLIPIDKDELSRWADSNDIDEVSTLEVNQIAIDDFINQHALPKIDVLKLDIQGGELGALQGAQAALRAQKIECIFAEVEFRKLYQDQPLAWDIHSFLSSYGYHFINFICPKETEAGILSWADAIYVSANSWRKLRNRHSAGKYTPHEQLA